MVPYEFIESDGALSRLIHRLGERDHARVAVDTEGESNLHSYGIHVSLIQLFDGDRGFVVDARAIGDKILLKKLLQESRWIKVMFGAANDLLSLKHSLDIAPVPVMDLAIATQLLELKGGLDSFVPKRESPGSKNRFQKANWLRRPLTKDMLEYAVSDVLHLLVLADTLLPKLTEKGLMSEFLKRNVEQQEKVREWDPFSNYVRIPGFKRMGRADKAFAEVLWRTREYYARQHDLPPENVASKAQLVSIIEKELKGSGQIVHFLNSARRKLPINAKDFGRWLAHAERDVRGPASRS
jgi:ribonuclease D